MCLDLFLCALYCSWSFDSRELYLWSLPSFNSTKAISSHKNTIQSPANLSPLEILLGGWIRARERNRICIVLVCVRRVLRVLPPPPSNPPRIREDRANPRALPPSVSRKREGKSEEKLSIWVKVSRANEPGARK